MLGAGGDPPPAASRSAAIVVKVTRSGAGDRRGATLGRRAVARGSEGVWSHRHGRGWRIAGSSQTDEESSAKGEKGGRYPVADQVFGARYLGQREPLCRTIGMTMSEGTVFDATAAFAQAGLLYRFAKVPLVATLPDGTQSEHSKVGVYREPTPDDPAWHELTTVDPKFELIQHDELAALIDPLARRWPVDTVGAVEQGKTVFVTLSTGSYEIARDEHFSYLLLSHTKGGAQALRFTP